jgi:GT2 family glycosyltransferase
VERALVSTITPSYRSKKYLQTFLEELPKQTLFNRLEVVLDHNEPDEEEVGWVRRFQARYPGRLKHLIAPSVVPIGTSMNRCIQSASADLLAIWNVDDLRTSDSIERQVRTLREHPSTGVVYGDWVEVSEFGSREGYRVRCDNFNPAEFTRSFLLGPFFLFRKSLCGTTGYFDEQLKSGADFDFAIRLAFHSRLSHSPGILGYHLDEGLGASTAPGSRQALERTVIELRYGIFDKLDFGLLPWALAYDVGGVYRGSLRTPVSSVIPNYETTIKERGNRWLSIGTRRQVWRDVRRRHPRLMKILRILRRPSRAPLASMADRARGN